MFQEEITNEDIVIQNGTSEGTQVKYRKGKYWYKKDNHGNEGLTEYLVSHMLTYSDLDRSEYVVYEKGTINGCTGCRSENFLKAGEELITFYRLYQNESGKDLSQVMASMETHRICDTFYPGDLWTGCDRSFKEGIHIGYVDLK